MFSSKGIQNINIEDLKIGRGPDSRPYNRSLSDVMYDGVAAGKTGSIREPNFVPEDKCMQNSIHTLERVMFREGQRFNRTKG
jgi:hypothetical protein